MSFFDTRPADRRFLSWAILFTLVGASLNSIWCIYIDDVVNNDAVEYIRAAERFAVRDWAGAFAVHQWPFFSALMWLTGRVFGISYEAAGYLLNSLFFSAASVFFVLVVHAFGGTTRRLVSLAVLLAVVHPSFNEYRSFIIRDAGYLAFYLVAVFFLARCANRLSATNVIGSIAALVAATLFRIEGAVFVVAIPLLLTVVLTKTDRGPWRQLILLVLSALILTVLLGWWLMAPKTGLPMESVADSPILVVESAWNQVLSSISHKMMVLQSEFLGPYSAEYAWTLFVFAVAMLLASATFSQLSIPWAVLVLAAIWFNVRFPVKSLNRLWASLILMHLVILLVFTVINLFLASRYPLALAVTMLVLAPFALDRVTQISDWRRLSAMRRVALVILLVWAAGESVSGLDNTTRARALKEAGLWLETQVDAPGSILTNDRRIAYYAGRHWDLGSIEPSVTNILHGLRGGLWPETTYVALRLTRGDTKTYDWVIEALGAAPLRTIDAGRGDRVLIYLRP
jgi:hypothetical protein